MSERVVPKMANFCVVKLSNSPAKAGPMSAANALGLTCVPRLELNGPTLRHFESQPDSLRINQRLPRTVVRPEVWSNGGFLGRFSGLDDAS